MIAGRWARSVRPMDRMRGWNGRCCIDGAKRTGERRCSVWPRMSSTVPGLVQPSHQPSPHTRPDPAHRQATTAIEPHPGHPAFDLEKSRDPSCHPPPDPCLAPSTSPNTAPAAGPMRPAAMPTVHGQSPDRLRPAGRCRTPCHGARGQRRPAAMRSGGWVRRSGSREHGASGGRWIGSGWEGRHRDGGGGWRA
jgi:hypothetical protein